MPTNGNSFAVVNGSTVSGAFSSFDLPSLPGGLAWYVNYSGNSVVASIAPGTNATLLISGVVTNSLGTPVAGASVYAYVDPDEQTNLIINGSFETPNNNGAGYVLYGIGSTNITGWTVTGEAADEVDLTSGFYFGAAEDGAQYFDPTGGGGSAGITQSFPTTIGVNYELIFFQGVYSYHNLMGLGLTINGTAYSFGEPTGGAGNLHWTEQIIPFTATSNSTTVAFHNISGFDANDNFVDNVQVYPANYDTIGEAVTDTNGFYQITVPNGTWQVNVADLETFGYNPVSNQTVALNGSNAMVNFVVTPFSGTYETVTTQCNPANAATLSGGGSYPEGSTVLVSASPNANAPWVFASWTEDGLVESTDPAYSFRFLDNFSGWIGGN
jgi:hypothetical protein